VDFGTRGLLETGGPRTRAYEALSSKLALKAIVAMMAAAWGVFAAAIVLTSGE